MDLLVLGNAWIVCQAAGVWVKPALDSNKWKKSWRCIAVSCFELSERFPRYHLHWQWPHTLLTQDFMCDNYFIRQNETWGQIWKWGGDWRLTMNSRFTLPILPETVGRPHLFCNLSRDAVSLPRCSVICRWMYMQTFAQCSTITAEEMPMRPTPKVNLSASLNRAPYPGYWQPLIALNAAGLQGFHVLTEETRAPRWMGTKTLQLLVWLQVAEGGRSSCAKDFLSPHFCHVTIMSIGEN